MKVALIQDWLTGMRGGEKVLELFCDLFPDADLFTLLHVPGKVSPTIERHRIITSPLQRIPGIASTYRKFLPLMPWAIEQFDFTGYDVLISTSHCVAKGAIPRGGAQHWDYCHTPMRYIWDQYDQYFGPGRAGLLTRAAMGAVRPYLQRWDRRSTERVHRFIANSKNVAERIRRLYNREAVVVYPPVDTEFYRGDPSPQPSPKGRGDVPKDSLSLWERVQGEGNEPFFLVVSALAPYKRIDLAVELFTRRKQRLVVIGDGQESETLRRQAGPSIRFLGWQDPEILRWYYANCQALLFPGEEDFGIVPVETMAAGRPVIAYRKGGALETVVDGVTGVFFDAQTVQALDDAIQRFQAISFDPSRLRAHAETFSRARCTEALRTLLR